MKNKPLWYKVGFSVIAIGAIYSLVKYFFFSLNAFDRFIQAFVLIVLLIDRLVVADNNSERLEP
jgi:hypothetical protein